jgi:hypothetical protein
MPRAFAQDNNGRYLTDGLSESQFIKVFNAVNREQANNRQSAKNTLRPRALKRKSIEDLVKLGKKEDGTAFTADDLKRFDELRKKFRKRTSGSTGITYNELIGSSTEKDRKRASNTSKDGLGIQNAAMIKLERGNVVIARVQASSRSVHQEHRVRIQLLDWAEELEEAEVSEKGYLKAVKNACRGALKIDCDCGRHQYWFRYMSSVGGYQYGRNLEQAYPKVRNPKLIGTACKHVLKVAQMLQSPIWQRKLAKQMERQATQVGFTDSGKGSTKTFGERDQKELSKNRSTVITEAQHAKAQAGFERYELRRKAMQKALKGKAGKNLQDGLSKIKKYKQQADKAQQQVRQLKQKLANEKRNALVNQIKSNVDFAVNTLGQSREAVVKGMAKKMNKSVTDIEKLLND